MNEATPTAAEPAPAPAAQDEVTVSPASDSTASVTFELVEGALVKLGFKKKEAVEAVATVGPPMDPTKQSSFEAVFREALAFLTPSQPPRRAGATGTRARPPSE